MDKNKTVIGRMMKSEKVGNFLIDYPQNVPKEEVDLIKKIVRDAQENSIKPRCKACYPCAMGVVGCDMDSSPHGHGSTRICEECGVPYTYIHPHSDICSQGTIVNEDIRHDDYHLRRQLGWKKDGY